MADDALSAIKNMHCDTQPTTPSDQVWADLDDIEAIEDVPSSEHSPRRRAIGKHGDVGALLPQPNTVVSAAASAGDPVVDDGDPYAVVDAVV